MAAFLPDMVHHLIGRKHRQKYVEGFRPDLVTWDTQSIVTQGGKIIRAKAEIIERQDGRGTPVSLPKTGNQGNFNNPRAPQRKMQNRNRMIEQQGQVASFVTELKTYRNQYSNQKNYPTEPQNRPEIQPEDPNMQRGRWHQWEDAASYSPVEAEPQRNQMYRDNFTGPDHLAQREFGQDPLGRATFEPGDRARMHDFRENTPRGQAQLGEYSPEKGTPYATSYPERGDEFYSEERSGERILSLNYNPAGEQQYRSREPGRNDMYGAGRQEFSEPEAKRSTFSPAVNNEQAAHSFSLVRDYHHKSRPAHKEETTLDYTLPDRAGASAEQLDVAQALSDIPEPFRRFLSGGTAESQGKRKRKSRFSDATPEELEETKAMFDTNDGPARPQFGGEAGAPPRRETSRMQYSDSFDANDEQRRPQFGGEASAPPRRETSRMQYSDSYKESEGLQYPESNQTGGSNSDDFFDVLKNIEIDNEEQANFLKSKLCGLLREFKSKKKEQETQNSQNRPGSFRNYEESKLEPQLPRHSLYERTPIQDTDRREAAPRDRLEHRPGQQPQGYSYPPQAEPRLSARERYEAMFETKHGHQLDEPPYYPERFQEPLRSHDYQPAVTQFYDSLPPMERGSGMNRGPRHSSSLDKIASTLLELVAKKS
ncbi:uncharacterized protein LOC115409177 isoform X2 [Salarias fasciatus]|nr:uncharacterized protein LOC115409177 isoform X2 [Salarias fasciatus]